MSEKNLETACNAVGDSCTLKCNHLNIASPDNLLKVNATPGEPNKVEEVSMVNKLTEEVQKRTIECDNYKEKLADTEKQLSSMQTSTNSKLKSGMCNEMSLQQELEDFKKNLAQAEIKIQERNRLIANQENQINALSKQVSSLKEVITITKSLLEIRNTEVKHLQEDVESMESKISEERSRHNLMINKMNTAVRLNADLKTEYETQLRLFQNLRGKYEEKAILLASEKKELEKQNAPKAE